MSESTLSQAEIQSLLQAAHAAYAHSYVPYSKFPVGSALLTAPDANGQRQIIGGCNVENASFGLAICAERVALTKAVSEGHRRFDAIAITAAHAKPCFPCGTCLQFIREFGAHTEIFFENETGEVVRHTIGDMLPYAFTSDDLAETSKE
ncbi:MAG: cytidine deaminase [Candidatus Sericytochromatia bacterium]